MEYNIHKIGATHGQMPFFGRETATYIRTLWWKDHCLITAMTPTFMPNNPRNDPS
jgi:hypothetical protein